MTTVLKVRIRRLKGWKRSNRRVRCIVIPVEQTDDRVEFKLAGLAGAGVLVRATTFGSVTAGALLVRPNGELTPPPELTKAVATPRDGMTVIPVFGVQGLEPDEAGENGLLDYVEDLLRADAVGVSEPPPLGATPTTLGDLLPFALDQLYRDRTDRELKDAGDRSAFPLLVAAGSGLIFDAVLAGFSAPPPDSVQWKAPDGEVTSALVIDSDEGDLTEDPQTPSVNVLEMPQYAHGLTFRMRLSPDGLRALFDGEHNVTLERWVAASPVGAADTIRVRRLPELDVSQHSIALHATDVLRPDELVGMQLHYRVTIQNEHGRTTVVGSGSLLRERLDAPAPVTAPLVVAQLSAPAGPGDEATITGLHVDLGLRATLEDDLEWSSVALYGADRGLDACGFYGDADDLALFAGLAALDLTPPGDDAPVVAVPAPVAPGAPPAAYRPPPAMEEILRDELEGRWVTRGLELLAIHDLHPSLLASHRAPPDPDASPVATGNAAPGNAAAAEDKPDRVRLTFAAGDVLESLLPPAGLGRRYYLVRFRQRRSANHLDATTGWRAPFAEDRERLGVTSALAECVHELRWGTDERVQVFQVERIAADPGQLFLAPTEIGHELSDHNDELHAPTVVMQLKHPRFHVSDTVNHYDDVFVPKPAVPPAAPVGGMRLWVRDRIGVNDAVPFREVATIQAVPPLVAGYRPLMLDGSHRWRLDPPDPAAPTGSFDEGALDDARRALGRARDQLLAAPGLFRAERDAGQDRKGGDLSLLTERFTSLGAMQPIPSAKEEGWHRDPRFAGTMASALLELGLCVRLSMHIDLYAAQLAALPRTAPGAEDVFSRRLTPAVRVGAVPNVFDERAFVMWRPFDEAWHPFATVLLMPRLKLTDPALDAALGTALFGTIGDRHIGPVPGGTGLYLRSARMETMTPTTRAFGADRVFRYGWTGVHDAWHHDLEFCAEVLDRYARIRELRAATTATFSHEVTFPNPVTESRYAVSLRRSAPVHDVVGIARDLSAPSRLVFGYEDPPERRAAAANALSAARSGPLRVEHALSRALVGDTHYETFLDKWPAAWETVSPAGLREALFATDAPPRAKGQSEERLDFGPLPPYFEYQCRSWLIADGQAGVAADAVGRVLPQRLAMPSAAAVFKASSEKTTPDDLAFDVHFRLARLGDSHAPDFATDAPATIGEFVPALEAHAWIPLDRLPDLELTYHVYARLGDEAPYRLVELFSLRGLAAPVMEGETPTPLYDVFRAVPNARYVERIEQRTPGAGLLTRFWVKLLPPEPADLVHRQLAALARGDDQIPGAIVLSRQGRSTPPLTVFGANP